MNNGSRTFGVSSHNGEEVLSSCNAGGISARCGGYLRNHFGRVLLNEVRFGVPGSCSDACREYSKRG